jgi:hypothetical protein
MARRPLYLNAPRDPCNRNDLMRGIHPADQQQAWSNLAPFLVLPLLPFPARHRVHTPAFPLSIAIGVRTTRCSPVINLGAFVRHGPRIGGNPRNISPRVTAANEVCAVFRAPHALYYPPGKIRSFRRYLGTI